MKNKKEYWYKLSDDSVRSFWTNQSSEQFLPDGASFVDAPVTRPDMTKYKESLVYNQTVIVTDLDKYKEVKLEEIRIERDKKLLENDKDWLIASKKVEDTSAIEATAQSLRDLPTSAATAMSSMTTVEEIETYNAFI